MVRCKKGGFIMSKKEIHENDLSQVSGGMVGPDPLYYAVHVKGVPFGSEEFNRICEDNGVDPRSVSKSDLLARQQERDNINKSLSQNRSNYLRSI